MGRKPKKGMERIEEMCPRKASVRRGNLGKDLKEEREDPRDICGEEHSRQGEQPVQRP